MTLLSKPRYPWGLLALGAPVIPEGLMALSQTPVLSKMPSQGALTVPQKLEVPPPLMMLPLGLAMLAAGQMKTLPLVVGPWPRPWTLLAPRESCIWNIQIQPAILVSSTEVWPLLASLQYMT